MNDANIGSAVRELVIAWLTWHDKLDRREQGAELEEIVEGYRLVRGGETDVDGSWEITDAHSGEVLAHGVGRESFDAAWQSNWTDADAIGIDAHIATDEPDGDFGLPPGLTKVLRDWVVDNPEEASQVIA